MYNMIINTAICYIWTLLSEEFSPQGKKLFFYFFNIASTWDNGVHWTYYGNHFMMYVSQIIMLATFNLHSAVCQLYLNKTGRKKNHIGDQRILRWYMEGCSLPEAAFKGFRCTHKLSWKGTAKSSKSKNPDHSAQNLVYVGSIPLSRKRL